MKLKGATGAAIVNIGGAEVFCHYSKKGQKIVFRYFENGGLKEIDGEEEDVVEFLGLSDCKLLNPNQKTYSILDNASAWMKILSSYEKYRFELGKPSKKSKSISVPVTRLRRYYGCMGVLEKAIHCELASFYSKDGFSNLRKLWNDSFATFSHYTNNQQWNLAKDLKSSKIELPDISDTDSFTQYLMANPLSIDDKQFGYVCREMNPWQTSGGVFKSGPLNGKSAKKTGRGGMDLLLAINKTPFIGEVKVKADKNAFYALIQAMTYAVEMTTDSQLERLGKQSEFDGVFATKTSSVGIAIILVNPVKDPTLDLTVKIAKKINGDKKFKRLGQILIVKNVGKRWEKLA